MSCICAATAVLFICVAGMPRLNAAVFQDSQFETTTKRVDDQVEVKTERDSVDISVRSVFDISQAVIERIGGDGPGVMIVRLRLRGLERFKLANGEVTLNGALSSHGGEDAVRLWLNDVESTQLTEQSDSWMEVRKVRDDGEPAKAIPLESGYLEMRLPRPLFEGNPKFITISWIDYYR